MNTPAMKRRALELEEKMEWCEANDSWLDYDSYREELTRLYELIALFSPLNRSMPNEITARQAFDKDGAPMAEFDGISLGDSV